MTVEKGRQSPLSNQFGQPLSATDALGQVTQFEYDAVGNLVRTIDPLGNRTTRAYDAVSRLISLTDARGFTTTFSYDALNGATKFSCDPNENLLAVIDLCSPYK